MPFYVIMTVWWKTDHIMYTSIGDIANIKKIIILNIAVHEACLYNTLWTYITHYNTLWTHNVSQVVRVMINNSNFPVVYPWRRFVSIETLNLQHS